MCGLPFVLLKWGASKKANQRNNVPENKKFEGWLIGIFGIESSKIEFAFESSLDQGDKRKYI